MKISTILLAFFCSILPLSSMAEMNSDEVQGAWIWVGLKIGDQPVIRFSEAEQEAGILEAEEGVGGLFMAVVYEGETETAFELEIMNGKVNKLETITHLGENKDIRPVTNKLNFLKENEIAIRGDSDQGPIDFILKRTTKEYIQRRINLLMNLRKN